MTDEMQVDTSKTEIEIEIEIETKIEKLQTALQEQNETVVADTTKSLLTMQDASLWSVLLPKLFAKESCNDALLVLKHLLSTNASLLGTISQTIHQTANKLQATSQDFYVSPEFISVLVNQYACSDNVSVSTNAIDTILICGNVLGFETFWDPAIDALVYVWQLQLNGSNTNKAQASTIAVRCANAAMQIMAQQQQRNNALIKKCISACQHLFQQMLTDTNDPLVQMSIIDAVEEQLLSKLTLPVVDSALLEWLQSNIAPSLVQYAGGKQDEPDPFIGGSSLRVLSVLCCVLSSSQATSEDNQAIRNGFYKSILYFCDNNLDRLALITAISTFAKSSEQALSQILQNPIIYSPWLSLRVAQPKLKAVILQSVAQVLLTDTIRQSKSTAMTLYTIFGQVNDNNDNTITTTQILWNLAKSPLLETRLACYALWDALVHVETGGMVMLTQGGNEFWTFLLSPNIETTYEGRLGKFQLLESISKDSMLMPLLSEQRQDQLQKRLQDGPHAKTVQRWDVDLE